MSEWVSACVRACMRELTSGSGSESESEFLEGGFHVRAGLSL